MEQKLYHPISVVALGTALLLMIPLTAMQLGTEVNWTVFDFVVAGGMLFTTGTLYVLATRWLAPRLSSTLEYRVAVGFSLFCGLFLLWTNVAVGIVGSESEPINVLYFWILLVGIAGAILARFRPKGLQWTMFAMALVQALIGCVALFDGVHQAAGITATEVIGVNGMFILLFGISALMFRYAHKQEVSRE